ncbi:putative ABC transport system ATP-binding protein [Clostridium cavendishii DSM 21758]|uniref:Putative ABC transport system ATP-binding protein n=1 Tax=Clostridium cavendishii DSM 21758 TaxID=1121302 RepID=A0A1M6TGW0_9CLOT|nr:ABC transporter ATP-binding protein [Clostridium cavendishii]SHK56227.1 putative ABC transport system ATP-binding protein [Clostridium cavendishii DSM 21758]
MNNVLIARNLKKVYSSKGNNYTALRDIDLDIKEGEFIGVMGPSGAGKTTLLNIVSTIDTLSSGSVIIDGDDIAKMKEEKLANFRRNKLGFVFQDYNLLNTLTIKENIILPLALSKINYKEIDKRVDELAKKFDIYDILNKYPYEVSGGQKQRASISRAIITKPALILADEPTGALDSKSSAEILQTLSDLNKNDNVTIMMVTHDAFAASYCKRIIFIKDGTVFSEIIRSGSRKEFFQKILDVLSTLGNSVADL